jgi:hypothetical protein
MKKRQVIRKPIKKKIPEKEIAPTFYRTKEYSDKRLEIMGLVLEAFKKNALTEKPEIESIEQGLEKLKNHKTQIKYLSLSRESKKALTDFCEAWIKKCNSYIKRNKGVKK